MYIITAGNQLFGLEIPVIQCLKSLAYPTKGQYREVALPVLEINGKPRMAFNGDRRASDEFQ